MWKAIAIKLLLKIWIEAFQKIEKMDITTKALEACLKNEMIRKTWKPFCKSVESFFKDCAKEANTAIDWDIDNM